MRTRVLIPGFLIATLALLPSWAGAAPTQRDGDPPRGNGPRTPVQAGGIGTAAGVDLTAYQGLSVVAVSVSAPAPLRLAVSQSVAVRIGSPYNVDDVRRSLQNIYSLGSVSDVQVHGVETDDGLRLEFVVFAATRLQEISFAGDSPIGTGSLLDALTVRTGDRITREIAEVQALRVQQALSGQGYMLAGVEPEISLDATGTRGTLVFHLDPGDPTRLSEFRIVGDNIGIAKEEARAVLGLREGGVYRSDVLGNGIDRLQRRLAEDHYFYADIQVAPGSVSFAANTTALSIRVEAGPRVELNVTGWDRSEEELHRLLPFFERTSVADWLLKQAHSDIVAALQSQGYWKPLVAYRRTRDKEGRNVIIDFTVNPVAKADLKRIDIEGSESISTEAIRATMETRERRLLRGPPFTTRQWEQDQRSILSLYRRSGFLEARIDEASVRRDTELGGLRAYLRIDEGPRSTVAGMTVDVGSGPGDYGVDTSGWLGELQLRSGGPFSPDAVRQDETRLRMLLANAGYPRALVTSATTFPDEDPHRANIAFTVFPGARVRVGQLIITGNRSVREEVIRRELSLLPGSPFTQEALIRSQSRLYQLGVFSRVDIETAQPDSIETEPTVVVRVEEGSSRRLSWGLGYSTEEHVRGLLVVGEDNLWGRNHRGTASIRASFKEQRTRLIYTNPYLFGRRLEGSAVGYYESIDQEGFKVQSYGASLQFVKRHSERLTSIGRYSFRDQRAFDIEIDPDELEPEDSDAIIGSFIYSLLHDSRPDPIDPRRGVYNTVDTELASKALGGEANFVKIFGRFYWYRELPGDMVFVAAGRAGLAVPYADSIVPLPQRFFAGGSTTLRGFGRNRAGPTDASGNPLGGEVLLIGNLELRFPIRSNLGAVLFVDVGNVFADIDSIALDESRETLGVGVRYSTPIGPLRLDWGHLLDRRTGEDSWRLHFAIGQAF